MSQYILCIGYLKHVSKCWFWIQTIYVERAKCATMLILMVESCASDGLRIRRRSRTNPAYIFWNLQTLCLSILSLSLSLSQFSFSLVTPTIFSHDPAHHRLSFSPPLTSPSQISISTIPTQKFRPKKLNVDLVARNSTQKWRNFERKNAVMEADRWFEQNKLQIKWSSKRWTDFEACRRMCFSCQFFALKFDVVIGFSCVFGWFSNCWLHLNV